MNEIIPEKGESRGIGGVGIGTGGSEWWVKDRIEEVALRSAEAMSAFLVAIWEKHQHEESVQMGNGDKNLEFLSSSE